MAEMPIVSYRGKAHGASEEIRENVAAQMLAGGEGGRPCHEKKIAKETLFSTAREGQGRM